MTRIVVLDDYQQVALDHAEWNSLPDGCEVVALAEHLPGPDAVVAALAGAEIVVAMRERTPFDAATLVRLPELRLLVTTGMGNAAIDVEAALRQGVVVSGTAVPLSGTLEHVWALILSLVRSIPAEDAGMRAGGWQRTVGFDLNGATLGLVGLGRLGSAMVPIARAFGMETIAWSENLDPAEAERRGARAVAKHELFANADIISVHYRLSPRSVGLIGAAELAAMKPTAYLVNTSRGPLLDAAALLEALESGAIAGAALDVYDSEPLPADDPLRSAPRTVLTPHLGYVTGDTYDVFYREAVEDIAAFLAGEPIRLLGG